MYQTWLSLCTLICLGLAKGNQAARGHVKCGVYGFTSVKSQELLFDALGSRQAQGGKVSSNGVTVVELDSSGDAMWENMGLALHSSNGGIGGSGGDAVPSDLAVMYTTASMIRFNEAAVLANLQRAFSSVLAAEDKRTVVVVVSVSGVVESSAENVENAKSALGKLAAEAWALLLEKASYRSNVVGDEVDLKIISTEELKNEPGIIKEILGTVAREVSSAAAAAGPKEIQDRSLQNLFKTTSSSSDNTSGGGGSSSSSSSSSSSNSNSINISTSTKDLNGFEDFMDAMRAAVLSAQEAAQASTAKLQSAECAASFPRFVENLIAVSLNQFHQAIEGKQVGSVLIRRSEEEVQRNIFTMLLPFYKRQVLLSRAEVAKSFNAAVGEDLEVTINIMDDLNRERRLAIAEFSKRCAALQPKGAPSATWNSLFDEQQLRESLDDYVAGREATAKAMGVLPRGRKPIDVSVHYLATHPFGRDYRQDGLLVVPGRDKIIFDENFFAGSGLGSGSGQAGKNASPSSSSASSSEVSVSALKARALLNQKAKDEALTFFERQRLKRDAEFAREMLMFPLSIKNPSVPLMAGRAKKRSSVTAAKIDPDRITFGPERFIRWDMPALQEAATNLDTFEEEGDEDRDGADEGKGEGLLDKTVKKLPGLYRHPPLNYGKKYRANQAQ